ncbi:MAG: amidohydrolase [Chitinophagaceae bacterium]|nr:MAG: amidohydrolase [Chitinophagaceae bacterium]
MENLNVTLVQFDIVWEKKIENLKKLDLLLSKNIKETDLIILPEMFTTGFSMRPERLAESMSGSTIQWMKKVAEEFNAVVCGSLVIEENTNYFNRMIWMRPDGSYSHYDKKHLFSLVAEQNHYTAGNSQTTVSLKGWNCSLQICYDLRFPVWCRNNNHYDLQIFVANWPDRRIDAWKTLLKARAIENQTYIAAVNRVGYDGNQIYHSGYSSLISPDGEIVWNAADSEDVSTIELNKEHLVSYRDKFRFLNDKDKFTIHE